MKCWLCATDHSLILYLCGLEPRIQKERNGRSSSQELPRVDFALWAFIYTLEGFPNGSGVKNLPAMQETQRHGFHAWVRELPWRKQWQPTPVFLLGEVHGPRSLASYSPRGHRKSDTTERAHTCVTIRRWSDLILKACHAISFEKECAICLSPLSRALWINFKEIP